MSLIALKQHLIQVKTATLSSLCTIFNAEADTVRCLLSHWMQKGCVRQCMKTPRCGSQCSKCPVAVMEMYEWVGEGV